MIARLQGIRVLSLILLALVASFAVIVLLRERPMTPVDSSDIRQMAARSVPFLETGGIAWIEEQKCVSCHQVPFMLWSLNRAHEVNVAGDPQLWTNWAVNWRHWMAPEKEGTEAEFASRNVDTLAQLVLGCAADSELPWLERLLFHLQATQEPDGSWKPDGQLLSQKRPERETAEVTTMWALLALQSSGRTDSSLTGTTGRAVSWLKDAKPGDSIEWWVTRFLMEHTLGNKGKADSPVSGL